MSNYFTIGGKARPGQQTENLKKAGFSVYEAVIIHSEDWDNLELEANAGLFPGSIDIKGREEEQRWRELSDRLHFVEDIGKSSPRGPVYVGVDGFRESIQRLQQLRYEYKAIEALPATSPAALDAQSAFPADLINWARSAESKILIDVCHLFQTGVYLQACQKPLEVTLFENGTYATKIPPEAAAWYYEAVQEIIDSGYLAPFAHTNGHVFVADPSSPVCLPDGRSINAFGAQAMTSKDWQGDPIGYAKNSYSLPISIRGEQQFAYWFKSHTFITDGEDEIYTVLDPRKSTQQLKDGGVKTLILENSKESSEKLRREAGFYERSLEVNQQVLSEEH